METIDYNGMKLEEFTSDKPITFEPAKKMFVWNEGYLFDEKLVLYVNTRFQLILFQKTFFYRNLAIFRTITNFSH